MNKKLLPIILSSLALAVIGATIFLATRSSDQNVTDSTQNTIQLEESPAGIATPARKSQRQVKLIALGQTATTVFVRAVAEGTNRGTCRVTFTAAGRESFELRAPLSLTGAVYTCQGFDVAKSEFATKGQWEVTVSLVGDTKTTRAQGTLNVE